MKKKVEVLFVLLPFFFSACSKPQAPGTSLEVLSETLTIDKKYKSMKGPEAHQEVRFENSEEPELLWITGYRAVNVGEDGRSAMPQEFMCHSIFDIDLTRHSKLFGWTKQVSSRLFTMSQGQPSLQFPKGFGIPVMSDESMFLGTQVLNHNVEKPNLKVRQKVNLDFIRDAELKEPIRPLYAQSIYGLVLLEGRDAYFDLPDPDSEKHGPGCLSGEAASFEDRAYDPFGRKFTGHWIVKPGRQENHTLVTKLLDLPFDTTVHYIGVHLHPFAESLELRDLTTGETVFRSRAFNFEDRIGLEKVDYYSSEKGKPLYKGHEYELISIYNNTSSVDQDSMAVMYLYLWDKEFRKPKFLKKAVGGL